MRMLSFFLALIVLGAMFVPACPQGVKDDLGKLQGAWTITELIVGGSKVPEEEFKGTTFVFSGNKLTLVPPMSNTFATASVTGFAAVINFPAAPEVETLVDYRVFTFKLDPAQKPATVDITFKDMVSPGIYDVTDDTLRWCQSDDEKTKERPKEFASPDKSRIYLFTLKRAK
jgi:uncharacterized protein (TIGR03067 family)